MSSENEQKELLTLPKPDSITGFANLAACKVPKENVEGLVDLEQQVDMAFISITSRLNENQQVLGHTINLLADIANELVEQEYKKFARSWHYDHMTDKQKRELFRKVIPQDYGLSRMLAAINLPHNLPPSF